jgi:hypothetical protein
MIGSIIWLVLDMVSLSGILNLPLSLLYRFMEKTAFFAGHAPGISASKPAVILAFSIILSLLIPALEYRSRLNRLRLREFL